MKYCYPTWYIVPTLELFDATIRFLFNLVYMGESKNAYINAETFEFGMFVA